MKIVSEVLRLTGVTVLIVSCCAIFAWFLGYPFWLVPIFIAVWGLGTVIHETGHWVAAKLLSCEITAIGIPYVEIASETIPWKRRVIAATGPLVELLYALALLFFSPPMLVIAVCLILSSVVSIFPIFPQSDGKKIFCKC